MHNWNEEEKEPIVATLRQFKEALKKHTEDYLHKTFRWATVETWIDNILQRKVEDIVMTALGYEKDSFHGSWKLRRSSHDKGGIQTVICGLAQKQAQELLPGFIEAKRAAINKKISTATFKKSIVEMYSSTLNDALHAEMKTWVEQNAVPVVKELFDNYTDEYLEQVKLKCPLTMDSLLLIAEGK